ncbi:MAG: hypothetical protein ACREEQ_09870, partial [Caulobacteraceae bacterium]
MVRVTVDVAAPAPTVPAAALASPSGTEAHLIAQSARTRGLRGGVKVLEGARAAYLQTEWSGSSDRRMP